MCVTIFRFTSVAILYYHCENCSLILVPHLILTVSVTTVSANSCHLHFRMTVGLKNSPHLSPLFVMFRPQQLGPLESVEIRSRPRLQRYSGGDTARIDVGVEVEVRGECTPAVENAC